MTPRDRVLTERIKETSPYRAMKRSARRKRFKRMSGPRAGHHSHSRPRTVTVMVTFGNVASHERDLYPQDLFYFVVQERSVHV